MKIAELEDHITDHERRVSARIVNLRTLMMQDIAEKGNDSQYKHGSDDVVLKEFHLPVHQPVELVIRSKDASTAPSCRTCARR